MNVIRISAGEQTEEILQFVLGGMGESALDSIGVEREHPTSEGLASEPVSTAVVLTLTSGAILAVTRLKERWIEARRQIGQCRVVVQAFNVSEEAGQALTALAEKHAELSVSFVPPPTLS